MNLTVLILTKNEELHIKRAIDSVKDIATRCVVVDSGSTDRTVEIAKAAGAEILHNDWVNYATQFHWGLSQLGQNSDWVMRLDADEIVKPELAMEIGEKLPVQEADIEGVYVSRRITFLGKRIQWGGVFPVRVLRLFRANCGKIENRWMDEHIIVSGQTAEFSGEIIDDNRNPITWWTEKHNSYASREVVDILNNRHGFMPMDSVADLRGGQQAGVKRWIKEVIYNRLPLGFRAFSYFFYRYIVRLGILDGKEGHAFHVLQGFWYRYLVDMKLFEVEKYMQTHDVDAVTAINDILKIDLQIKPVERN